MDVDKPKIVVVAGPTASGKTALGLRLAEKFNGEIVSADSIQVYRYMDIGSAKPSPEERSRVPHHMIDIRDPDEDFSAGDYLREARRCVDDILSRGRVPIVVGGTGLYIKTLLHGLVGAPSSSADIRIGLKAEEEQFGPGTLYEKLVALDPEAAHNIGRENFPRIVRALEVIALTGRKMSEFQANHGFRECPYVHLLACLDIERTVLYERIDKRVDSMVKEGLIEEVRNLYSRGYSRDLKALQSLGYRHAAMILSGEMDRNEAIRLMKRDTRRYAKRQLTWFRSEPEACWCDPRHAEGIELMVSHFLGR
jgi:tRNA dimethylallyltransferase